MIASAFEVIVRLYNSDCLTPHKKKTRSFGGLVGGSIVAPGHYSALATPVRSPQCPHPYIIPNPRQVAAR